MPRDAEQAYLDRPQTRLDELVKAGSLTPDARASVLRTVKSSAAGDDAEIARIQRDHRGRILFRDDRGRFAPEATAPTPAPVAVALSEPLSDEDEAAEVARYQRMRLGGTA